jgi:hypothetical protein
MDKSHPSSTCWSIIVSVVPMAVGEDIAA